MGCPEEGVTAGQALPLMGLSQLLRSHAGDRSG